MFFAYQLAQSMPLWSQLTVAVMFILFHIYSNHSPTVWRIVDIFKDIFKYACIQVNALVNDSKGTERLVGAFPQPKPKSPLRANGPVSSTLAPPGGPSGSGACDLPNLTVNESTFNECSAEQSVIVKAEHNPSLIHHSTKVPTPATRSNIFHPTEFDSNVPFLSERFLKNLTAGLRGQNSKKYKGCIMDSSELLSIRPRY
jgi:hypothetical protein